MILQTIMSSQREAMAKTEFIKECTFKPQRDESTHSLAKVRATVKKSNKEGTAKAQKRESSINQFVEVAPSSAASALRTCIHARTPMFGLFSLGTSLATKQSQRAQGAGK